jgi:hypothetical protein
MREYKYRAETLNFTVYLVPDEIRSLDLDAALQKYRTKDFLNGFTWTFAEKEAFLEMLNNENTIILR